MARREARPGRRYVGTPQDRPRLARARALADAQVARHRWRRTRSMTSFRTIATKTATASCQSRRTSATARPTPVPTTRLPSCIGTQSGQYNQSGRRFTARNTRCSGGLISGRRAPANDPPSTTTPTAAMANALQSVTALRGARQDECRRAPSRCSSSAIAACACSAKVMVSDDGVRHEPNVMANRTLAARRGTLHPVGTSPPRSATANAADCR